MSGGAEIVGIVLALYPIIIDAWQAYKSDQTGVDISLMITRLKTEQIIFREFLDHLVGSSVSANEKARLLASNPRRRGETGEEEADCWQSAELRNDLNVRLGYHKMQNVLDIIANIQDLLETMQSELPPSRPLLQKHSTIPSIKHFRPSKHPDTALRLKLDSLRVYNHDLQRLLDSNPIAVRRCRPKRLTRTPRFLRGDYSHALDIYNALCNGYKCTCEKPHLANLKLPRLDEYLGQAPDASASDDALELLFSIEDPLPKPAIVDSDSSAEASDEDSQHPTSCDAADFALEQSDFWTSVTKDIQGKLPMIHDGRRRTSQVSICECPDQATRAIDDFCQFVRTFGGTVDIHTKFFDGDPNILSLDEKRFRIQAPSSGDNQHESGTRVPLHEFLDEEISDKRKRMKLALQLSFAILQYYSTGWINPRWTWRDFSVSRVEEDESEDSQLFVTTKFYSVLKSPHATPTKTSSIWTVIREPILTRLGFALIELALGKRLAELRDQNVDQESMDPDLIDYATARKILERGVLRAEQGNEYEAVVRACIDHEFYCHTQYKCLDSRQKSFQRDVEECVITPLHSLWISLWGQRM